MYSPPYSNTGVVNTNYHMLGNKSTLKNKLKASIDWIAFTSTILTSVREMMEFLGYKEEDFQLLPKGANGYSKVYRLNGYPVSVMAEGNEGMGIHVVVAGSAIEDMLQHYQNTLVSNTPFGVRAVSLSDFNSTVMLEFLRDIKRIGWLTRLDLAVDDLGGQFFSVEDFREHLNHLEVVSKFRTFRDVYESTLSRESTGHTIYLGSRQSEVMLRLYDKQLEQNRRAEKEEDKIPYPWVRWELELKNQRANIAADYLIQRMSLGEVITEILNNYVRVVVLDDSNRSRCSMHPVWEKFLGTVKKLTLYVEEAKKTIEEKRRWIVRSVMPTLAGIIVADGGSFDIITSHFDDALLRMSGHMQELVTRKNPDWVRDYEALLA